MGRMYTVAWAGTVTNAGADVDLLEVLPADDKIVRLRRMLLSQTSEVGDAAEECLRITIYRLRATVTGGSSGTAAADGSTLNAVNADDTAAGFAAEYNNTTVATTSGNSNALAELGWNERASPYEMFWSYEDAPKVKQGEALVVRQQTTAADDYSGCFTFWLEED